MLMPEWASFDLDSVMWLACRIDPLSALDRPWPGPDFSRGQQDIDELFGLGGKNHFLRHHRGLIPRLWETQVTRAFRAMLLETPALTLDRCQALLSALRGAGAPTLAAIDRITADASDRMDLAIHARTIEDVPCCIVVEAKLDSDLSDDQLARYLRGVAARYPRREQRHLWVVAPTRSPVTMAVLRQRENREWNFTTWRRLLIDWQITLADDPGQDILSLFGEVWKRVGGR